MTIDQWLKKYDIEITNHQLIDEAFTHTSYLNEHPNVSHDNERLEFMGDAVMEIWVSERLFSLDPPISEGKMTSLRQKTVCEATFANIMRELDLAQFIKLGVGEEKNGGRNKDSILADTFEAFIGAIYLDCGMEAVDRIITPVLSPLIKHPEETGIIDYKSQLQEYAQADIRKSVTYKQLSVKGPANNPIFEMAVYLDDIVLGVGVGPSKKQAEQNAAKEALNKLVK